MSASTAAAKKGAVFLGDKFVELDDPSAVTLEDLCESFGTPWESGMHVRHRSTGRVVATLPFEPLPPLSEVADRAVASGETTDLSVSAEPALHETTAAAAAEEDGNNEDESNEEEGDVVYAVVYDLVNSNAPEMDGAAAALAGPLTENIRDIPGIEATMRQLVELGAAELLTAEPASVVHGKREYHPTEAPGLLRRLVYPASQYSPYRAERDPVSNSRHALFRSTSGTAATAASTSSPTGSSVKAFGSVFVGEGGPYTSYLDNYALSERVEVSRLPSSAETRRASLIVPLTAEEQQRIFGA